MLIDKTGLQDLNDSKAFTEFSNDMEDVYKNIETGKTGNAIRKRKKLIVLYDNDCWYA